MTTNIATMHRARKNADGLPRRRRSFTLVELMVTVAIIGILASIILFAMVSAMNAARIARTKVLIATLDRLLMERWESYAIQRIPIQLPSNATPQRQADIILQATRELMKIEMPDRWTDITVAPSLINPNRPERRTALALAYLRRYQACASHPNIIANQGAECLYLIITLGCGDGEARELFSADDIKDTDGDGMFEFVDGWGKPISFLRWPAGFVNTPDRYVSDVQQGSDAEYAHDPFDPMEVEPTAYRLYPLIYSAGPDGAFDIVANNAAGNFQYAVNNLGKINPYQTTNGTDLIGTPKDTDNPLNGEEFWDNITNHIITTR